MNYSLEILCRIWDDENGTCVEVGPDSDNPGLIEIKYLNNAGKVIDSVSIKKDMAKIVSEALVKLTNEK